MTDPLTAAPLRIGLIDDHELIVAGITTLLEPEPMLVVAASAPTVADLLTADPSLDLVVLDLRLADGSEAGDNVAALKSAGIEVLVLTGGEHIASIRSAARAGALGMVRKSESSDTLLDAIRRAAFGETVASTEWAAAIDSDERLADAGLSDRERQVLALYAAGEKAQAVANRVGISRETVATYISRVRTKYQNAGRPAHTKVDLYRRAQEDGLLPDAR